MLYIGVDLGTSAVKMLLMSADGKIEKIVSKEYPLSFPHPGWSEQSPEDWWTQVMAGLKELTSECDKSQIAGISFGGQMHGLVILDKDEGSTGDTLWIQHYKSFRLNPSATVLLLRFLNQYQCNTYRSSFLSVFGHSNDSLIRALAIIISIIFLHFPFIAMLSQ